MIIRFFIYGLIGWCIEILWTGLGAALSGSKKLMGYTYLWMLPIYGAAIFLEPIHYLIMDLPVLLRGGVWVVLIYFIEYATGWAIRKKIGICPWDYGNVRYAVDGLIRLDYAPAWFVAGLLFEKIHFLLLRILS
ncbi:MAG: putative ABC transporter permease [Bacillota bacterium]